MGFLSKFLITFSLVIFTVGNQYSLADFKKEVELNSEENLQKKLNQNNIITDDYILGSGDGIFIKFGALDDVLGGQYLISPQGFVTLRRVGSIYARDYTVSELKRILIPKYSEFVIDPDFEIYINVYRPIKVFINGEVKLPGLYDLSPKQNIGNQITNSLEITNSLPQVGTSNAFPTLFDAIKVAGGVTNYSDLRNVKIVRRNTISNGGGFKTALIDLMPLFIEGDQTLNIDLSDGDTIIIGKSEEVLKEQFLDVARTNLNPSTISVFVSGNVKSPGLMELPKGSGLTQAIAVAGGKKRFSGNVEFLRFERNGKLTKRKFRFKPNSNLDSYQNPILISGDIIRVNESIFGFATGVLNEISPPITNTYGLYKIFGGD